MQQYRINYLDLASTYKNNKKKYLEIFDQVMRSGQYVPQKNVETFENKICKFLKVKYCVTLNSGTDALLMALYSLNLKKGDEIITTPVLRDEGRRLEIFLLGRVKIIVVKKIEDTCIRVHCEVFSRRR